MKKLILSLLTVFFSASCTHNTIDEIGQIITLPQTLTASLEGNDSRIQLLGGKSVWNAEDCISVFYKSFDNLKWIFQGEDGDKSGYFKLAEGNAGAQTMNNTIVAYPYDANYLIDTNNSTLIASLPATQHYRYESYGLDENLMVANCEHTSFTLRNVCGWLKIQLTGNGEKITKLKLKGNNNEQVAGVIYVCTEDASLTLYSNQNDANFEGNVEFENSNTTELILDCGNGVELSAAPTEFYITIPPLCFENGITLTVESIDGNSMTVSTYNELTISRNHICPMAVIEYYNDKIPQGSKRATINEFLNANEDDTIYILNGKITSVNNTTYGNFDITDNTATVFVYGLLTPEGVKKTQWKAAGLKLGDTITIYGTRSSYNGNPQMKDAIYVAHIPYIEEDEEDSEIPSTPVTGKYSSDSAFVCSSSDTKYYVYPLDSSSDGTNTTIEGEIATGFKLGTTNYTGVFTSQAVDVSGDMYLNFYAVAWKNMAATIYFKVDNGAVYSQELTANNGASYTPPYNSLTLTDSDHYSFKLSGLKSSSKITFSTSPNFDNTTTTNTRAILCGVKLSNKPIGEESDNNGGSGNDEEGNENTGDNNQSTEASNTWLELPAIRTDGAYPNAAEYVITSGGERNYTHYYDTSTYASMWVAYPLASKHMGSYSRPSKWSYNPLVSTSDQINLCDRSYTNTDVYSRGHLIPNASRNGIQEMQLQTFYVTNSVPQVQNGFNGGVWMHLENAIREEVGSDEIYVVTGVAFHKGNGNESISYTTAKDDSRNIPIPNYFYKVVLKVKKNGNTVTSASTIGFWFENKAYSDSYTEHTVSVDNIEEWTGFNFFVNLPDSIEESAERNSDWSTFSNF